MRSQLKNNRGNLFHPLQNLNHGPLKLKAGVLPTSYADPFDGNVVEKLCIMLRYKV